MGKIQYAVIDDYGDDWKEGEVAFGPYDSLSKAERKAEAENYHSASIVKIVDGVRTEKVGP